MSVVEQGVQKLENAVMGENTPQQQTETSGNAATTSQEAPQAPQSADEWYDSLDETTRGVVDAYASGSAAKLKTALDQERQQRKAFEKQVKELSGKVGSDDKIKGEIDNLHSQLTESNLKASFYEAAAEQAGLPAKRYAAAYKIARLDGLIDDEGTVDWKALQEQHDYLFVSAPQEPTRKPGSAGSGVNGKPPQPSRSMNDLIRRSR